MRLCLHASKSHVDRYMQQAKKSKANPFPFLCPVDGGPVTQVCDLVLYSCGKKKKEGWKKKRRRKGQRISFNCFTSHVESQSAMHGSASIIYTFQRSQLAYLCASLGCRPFQARLVLSGIIYFTKGNSKIYERLHESSCGGFKQTQLYYLQGQQSLQHLQ